METEVEEEKAMNVKERKGGRKERRKERREKGKSKGNIGGNLKMRWQ